MDENLKVFTSKIPIHNGIYITYTEAVRAVQELSKHERIVTHVELPKNAALRAYSVHHVSTCTCTTTASSLPNRQGNSLSLGAAKKGALGSARRLTAARTKLERKGRVQSPKPFVQRSPVLTPRRKAPACMAKKRVERAAAGSRRLLLIMAKKCKSSQREEDSRGRFWVVFAVELPHPKMF